MCLRTPHLSPPACPGAGPGMLVLTSFGSAHPANPCSKAELGFPLQICIKARHCETTPGAVVAAVFLFLPESCL